MTRSIHLILIVFFIILAAGMRQAQADTDYHCLAACSNSGKTASVCLPQCSYNITLPAPAGATPIASAIPLKTPDLTPHNVLHASQPIDNTILLHPKAGPVLNVHEDYKCIAQCLQNKLQYQFCEQGCTISTTDQGKTLATPNGGSLLTPAGAALMAPSAPIPAPKPQ